MFYMTNFIMIFLFFIINILILLNKINNMKKKINKSSSIECGFNNFSNKHLSLTNNFFMIMIIFMIFDLEFFLLIPMIFLLKNFNWLKIMLMLIPTLMFMFYSMLYEIKFKSIQWIK